MQAENHWRGSVLQFPRPVEMELGEEKRPSGPFYVWLVHVLTAMDNGHRTVLTLEWL